MVHGGLLALRDNEEHLGSMTAQWHQGDRPAGGEPFTRLKTPLRCGDGIISEAEFGISTLAARRCYAAVPRDHVGVFNLCIQRNAVVTDPGKTIFAAVGYLARKRPHYAGLSARPIRTQRAYARRRLLRRRINGGGRTQRSRAAPAAPLLALAQNPGLWGNPQQSAAVFTAMVSDSRRGKRQAGPSGPKS